jgi:hypothetical protein
MGLVHPSVERHFGCLYQALLVERTGRRYPHSLRVPHCVRETSLCRSGDDNPHETTTLTVRAPHLSIHWAFSSSIPSLSSGMHIASACNADTASLRAFCLPSRPASWIAWIEEESRKDMVRLSVEGKRCWDESVKRNWEGRKKGGRLVCPNEHRGSFRISGGHPFDHVTDWGQSEVKSPAGVERYTSLGPYTLITVAPTLDKSTTINPQSFALLPHLAHTLRSIRTRGSQSAPQSPSSARGLSILFTGSPAQSSRVRSPRPCRLTGK